MKIYIDLYRKISLERKMIDLTNARIRAKSMLEISSDFFFFKYNLKKNLQFTIPGQNYIWQMEKRNFTDRFKALL